jgi:hypothetical protein
MAVKNPEGKSLCACRDANEERGREGEQKAETGLRYVRACVASEPKSEVYLREGERATQVKERQEIATK